MIAGLDFTDDPGRGCATGKVDPDVFFADRSDRDAVAEAKRTCRTCPFKAECLDRALDTGEQFGIWGGVLMSSAVEKRKAVAKRHDRQVTDLWRQGLADGVIALRLSVHPGAVSKIRARLGLPAHFGPGGRPTKREQVAA